MQVQELVHEVQDAQPEVREERELGESREVLQEHLGREGGREGGGLI